MLQASHTRLLNSNNFAAIGDSDRVYNTTPEGLTELTAGLATDVAGKPSLPDYIGVANYCKSLVLNPAINSFYLQVDDIMRIWETRILCMFIVNIFAKKNIATHSTSSNTSTSLVSDKMLQVEAGNVLDQVAYLNSSNGASSGGDVLQKQSAHLRPRKEVKLNRQFTNVLLWIKHAGRDLALLDHYYKEVFRARTSGQHDQEYLGKLQFAILGVLLRRKELFTAYTIASQDNQLTSEQMHRVRDRIESNAPDTDLFCLRLSLELEPPTPPEPTADGADRPDLAQNPLYQQLAETLDSCT